MSPAQKNRVTFIAPATLIGIAACLVLFTQAQRLEVNGDESGWISSAYYYTDLLLQFDLNREKWDCSSCGPWGSLNMPLGKWLFGFPLKLYSLRTGYQFSGYYAWGLSQEQNQAQGRVPPPDILLLARFVSVVFGVLCCLLLFAVGHLSANWWTGLLAAGLLLANDLFIRVVARALTDSFYIFFLLCGCLASIHFLRSAEKFRAASIICGVMAGLACSVKVSGLVVVGLLFLIVVAARLLTRKFSAAQARYGLVAFSGSAIAVAYLLNPFFWPSPQDFNLEALRLEVTSLTQEVSVAKQIPADLGDRYAQITNLTRVLGLPRLFQRWQEALNQSEIQNSARWRGNRLLTLHQHLFFELTTFPLVWIFLAIGIGADSLAVYRAAREKIVTVRVVPWAFFLINYLTILVFLSSNFSKYYLYTVVGMSFIAATGIKAVVCAIRKGLVWFR